MDDRTPPQDVHAEQSVLGAMMLRRDAITEVVAMVKPEDFYRPAHEVIFSAAADMHRRREPVDAVTLAAELTSSGDLARVGGATYLQDCVSLVPTAANAGYYAGIVRERAVLRRLVDAGTKIVQLGYSWDGGDVEDALSAARKVVDEAGSFTDGGAVRTFAQALEAAVDAWSNPETATSTTGWADLDKMLLGGWRAGHLTILGARPAVGKSVIAAQAATTAAQYGAGCAFFSLEMSEAEVTGRAVAHTQGIDLSRIESHTMTDLDWQKLSRLSGVAHDWPLFIDDRSGLTMGQIAARVRQVTRRHPIGQVVIDYLQLVRSPKSDKDSREREVSKIAEDCKNLAREFDVHVLALSQVNRGPTGRQDKRPLMSDLRESGGLEAHADEIILLHRDDDQMPGEIELNVEKNRHGRTGRVALAWAPHQAAARQMWRGEAS